MKAKLFLFYLRFRKPIIPTTGLITLVMVSLNQWVEYKDKNFSRNPWQIVSVESGEKFTVHGGNKTKTINLCGVKASGNRSRNFLRQVIDLGNGTVNLKHVGDSYEAWISIDKNYDVELVKHISSQPNYLVEETIHLNTWLIERGFARRDKLNSGKCSQPENLVWAEERAKEKGLGI